MRAPCAPDRLYTPPSHLLFHSQSPPPRRPDRALKRSGSRFVPFTVCGIEVYARRTVRKTARDCGAAVRFVRFAESQFVVFSFCCFFFCIAFWVTRIAICSILLSRCAANRVHQTGLLPVTTLMRFFNTSTNWLRDAAKSISFVNNVWPTAQGMCDQAVLVYFLNCYFGPVCFEEFVATSGSGYVTMYRLAACPQIRSNASSVFV